MFCYPLINLFMFIIYLFSETNFYNAFCSTNCLLLHRNSKTQFDWFQNCLYNLYFYTDEQIFF